MKRKFWITICAAAMLALCAFGLAGCGSSDSSTDGTYYLYENSALNKEEWYSLSGSDWSDHLGASGTFAVSGTNVTFYVEILGSNEELFGGTIENGVLTIDFFGTTMIYCKEGSEPSGEIEQDKTDSLEYSLVAHGTAYEVSGIGTADDTSITIPTTYQGLPVIGIGDSAFKQDSNLESVTINENVNYIGDCAFKNCTELTSVTIGNVTTSIGESAFAWCYKLESVSFGDGITSIGSFAFERCYALTSITIPNNVRSIGNFAFSGCNSLTSVSYMGDIAGWCSISGLESLMTGNKTLYIEGEILGTSIEIPNGVTSIADFAFA